ncbi:MAG: hypothetical protein IH596_02325 [Bacteroidales bacterium]|nr:hypothetical protein [Bacteroidales bacterium]
MSDIEPKTGDNLFDIQHRMNILERRMEKLESLLEQREYHDDSSDDEVTMPRFSVKMGDSGESLLESRIGEFGLAWLGNIVLFFGIIFLAQYLTNIQQPLLAALIGYAAVIGILALSKWLKESYSYMSFLFGVFGQLLMFYVTLRLHFFTANPVIPWQGAGVALLLTVIAVEVYLAFKKTSEFYASLALIMMITTAIISDTTHIMLPVITAAGAGTLYLFYRFGWYRILIIAIILTYFTLLMWILNNPLVGNPVQGITAHHYSYIYLAACAAIFSLIALIPRTEKFPDKFILIAILVNGFLFSSLLLLWVVAFFPKNYIWLFFSITLFCIPYSILLKKFSVWKYSPALYALYGFVAISITIYGLYNFPRAYLLLSIQSFLVVSIAIWYRSRIIIVMNVFLFITILVSYLATSASSNLINFSFPLVAFLSVRVINWQKTRLNLETEVIRNTYLIMLFFTTLYALYQAVPGPYITLSWTVAGVVFFVLSLLLKSMKYRWMALAGFIATAFYLFAVDLAKVELIYRIVAFLFLAIISIGISIYYVKKLKKKQN